MKTIVEKRVSDFTPSINGLKFPNYFKDVPLPEALEKFIDTSNTVYGMCGGMCFAVIDHHTAKKPVPDTDSVPDKEQPLWKYLYDRQMASWGKNKAQVLRYTKWMAMSDEVAAEKSAESWQELKKGLDKNSLSVLGLVYRDLRETLRVWDNHQVLAHGYAIYDDGSVHVNLYDPNYAKDDSILLKLKPVQINDETGYEIEQHRKGELLKNVHGFFVVPYKHADPPGDLGKKKQGPSRGG